MKPQVIVIVGQTATGKSNLAVKIAKKYNGEIISADSRQVYKALDIGTGKITKKEMQGVPHHLLDVANPKKKFTVVDFQKMAIYAMTDICKRGKIPIICGGTGFYIDAVTNGEIYPEVPPNLALRKRLYSKSAITLFEYLRKIDARRARTIDPHNKVRLVRAIEVAKFLGKVPKIIKVKSKYKFIKIGLALPEVILKKKIARRVKTMFKKGLLKEVKKLRKLGITNQRLKEFGFEYHNPTLQSVTQGSTQYAKRQMTWFKRDQEIKWFDLSSSKTEAQLVKEIGRRLRA